MIGDKVRQDVSVSSIYRELEERWNVYFVLPDQSSYFNDPEIADHWKKLLGERFVKLDDPAAVCELIALTVGIGEDRIDCVTDWRISATSVQELKPRPSARLSL